MRAEALEPNGFRSYAGIALNWKIYMFSTSFCGLWDEWSHFFCSDEAIQNEEIISYRYTSGICSFKQTFIYSWLRSSLQCYSSALYRSIWSLFQYLRWPARQTSWMRLEFVTTCGIRRHWLDLYQTIHMWSICTMFTTVYSMKCLLCVCDGLFRFCCRS